MFLINSELLRYRAVVYGIIQGVGFRPFIYNCALKYELKGYVKNDGGSVLIDVEGSKANVKGFIKSILGSLPPLARIEAIHIRRAQIKGWNCFEIQASSNETSTKSFIPQDTAICEKCKRDILHEGKWKGYAFTNCTDCGPRYSIIGDMPYDRKNTSMEKYEMCSSCKEEYLAPSSRRFHAQPVCCPSCGPQLELLDCEGKQLQVENVIKEAGRLLREGKLIAVKGLGGFHLMCDAENENAVARLRHRKHRPHRALAVMASDMSAIEKQCEVSAKERDLLFSPKSPIVLLRKKANGSLPRNISPDNGKLGMMLPYTPFHVLLFQEHLCYLVATSGNISGMPIIHETELAVRELADVADFFIIHNRDIHTPIDDAVVKVWRERECITRPGRGYAPYSFHTGSKRQLAALGAEQKSTISLSKDGYIYMSQHLGDLKNHESYVNYKMVLNNLLHLLRIKPEAYIHDCHPYYMSTLHAQAQERSVAIQHHFAHMASCIAEHKIRQPVIAAIYDGTGLGEDGKLWGGEFLVGDLTGFTRVGHLKYCTIQGMDKAVEEPWRTAASYLFSMGALDACTLRGVDSYSLELLKGALTNRLHCYQSSSIGRLFDAVSALLGLCTKATYEAQGAIRLEAIAQKVSGCYEYQQQKILGSLQIDYDGIFEGILQDLKKGRGPSEISGKFHNTVSDFTTASIMEISREWGIRTVVLSGGCFENNMLLESIMVKLESAGLQVFTNEKVPCNDGGISFGQLAAADKILEG